MVAAGALVCATTVGTVLAEGDPSAEPPPATLPVPPVEPPAPVSSTIPAEVGVVDGVEVAVGTALVPPEETSVSVGVVDGVEVAVGLAPVPPTSVGQASVSSRGPFTTVTPAGQRVQAVSAATRLMDSLETIGVLLDAWR